MAVIHYRPKRTSKKSEVKTENKKEEKTLLVEESVKKIVRKKAEPVLPIEEEIDWTALNLD